MTHITYHVVPHDGGWAHKLGDVFSETFATREAAMAAARQVAREQSTPGRTVVIDYEDEHGRWHVETSQGDDRPDVAVES